MCNTMCCMPQILPHERDGQLLVMKEIRPKNVQSGASNSWWRCWLMVRLYVGWRCALTVWTHYCVGCPCTAFWWVSLQFTVHWLSCLNSDIVLATKAGRQTTQRLGRMKGRASCQLASWNYSTRTAGKLQSTKSVRSSTFQPTACQMLRRYCFSWSQLTEVCTLSLEVVSVHQTSGEVFCRA